jgi:hypothetical protein
LGALSDDRRREARVCARDGPLSGASELFRQNDAREERRSLAGGADGVPEARPRAGRGALVVGDNPLEWPACKREALRT